MRADWPTLCGMKNDMTDREPGMPDELAGATDEWFTRHVDGGSLAGVIAPDTGRSAMLRKVVACSPYAAEMIARRPELLSELIDAGRLDRSSADVELLTLFAAAVTDNPTESDVERQLRHLRHRELIRIIWRDLGGVAGVQETLADLSAVADAAICAAIAWARVELESRYGRPQTASGAPAAIVVLGMGKLGGRELNFSSDVDLVFGFTEHGETDGTRPTSNEEFFRALARRVIGLLSKKTSDGFVYRVDTRLRPFGDSGPLAVSLPALETYLSQHGRDWERYAYVKARVINDWDGAGEFYDQVLRPFVYRRYLDYGVFSSLRDMKAMIEAEVRRKEFRDNIKLGRGGIREIEFIVQTLQLVRGGTIPELRERGLLRALGRLVRPGCLSADAAATLREAYEFLRLFENRLQAINDRQTHDVPADPTSRSRLALAMGTSGWEPLAEKLALRRDAVAEQFRNIVLNGDEEPNETDHADDDVARAFADPESVKALTAVLADLGYTDPAAAVGRLNAFRDSGFYLRLDEAGRQRLNTLMPRVIAESARQTDALTALVGVLTIIESIGRRSAYFSLLTENPGALERLVSLCSMSGMLVTQIAAHPLLLDELLDRRIFAEPPTREGLAADLADRLPAELLDDPEASRMALRNFKQAATFRIAVTDLSGALPLMKVSDRLTDIAEITLAGALDLAWHELTRQYGVPGCVDDGSHRAARFAIVGYGKLGGLELGYGSDLDIIFLHDSKGTEQCTDGDKSVDNAVFFVRLAQRIIHILTMSTSTGPLYEVDTRLRPNGKSGLLVATLSAFGRYQREQAWTWEHQALLRSRPVAGDATLQGAFAELRRSVLAEDVHRESLRDDVVKMREKMRAELNQGTDELFDLKQGAGGVTDIEFIVQYLVLRDAARAPDLTFWSDNIRQLEALSDAGVLTPDEAAQLAAGYREFRGHMHRLALAGQPRLMPRNEIEDSAGRTRAIWQQVFA